MTAHMAEIGIPAPKKAVQELQNFLQALPTAMMEGHDQGGAEKQADYGRISFNPISVPRPSA